MSSWQIALLIALIVVAWLGFWVSLLRLIARFGGWRTLALVYPLPPRSPLDEHVRHDAALAIFRLQSITLCKWVGYNHGITFEVHREGLAIRVLWIIRPGHATILIPWSQFTVTPTTVLGMRVIRLETEKVPQIPLTISARLAAKLKAAAGERWPE